MCKPREKVSTNKSLKDELISLRKNQIKWGLFFLLIKCGLFFLRFRISKPSSSGDDMPGCRHNSTVTRNLEIRHEAIVSVLAQWTSQTGMDELYLNGRVDRMLLDINPIQSDPLNQGTDYSSPLLAALHCYSILHMSCVPLMLAPFFFFFNWSDLRKLCLATICLHQCLRIIWLKARSCTSSLDHVWKVFATPFKTFPLWRRTHPHL